MNYDQAKKLDEVHAMLMKLVVSQDVTQTLVRQLVADREIVMHEVLRLRDRVAALESKPPEAA